MLEFRSWADTLFSACIFYNNKGVLLSQLSSNGAYGVITLIFCVISHSNGQLTSVSGGGKFTITTNIGGSAYVNLVTLTLTMLTETLAITHLNTANCIADIPAFQPIPSPSQLEVISLPPSPTECYFTNPDNIIMMNILSIAKFIPLVIMQ